MEKYFTIEMWEDIMSKIVHWIIYDMPGLLFIFVILFILLRVNRMFFKRLNGLLIRRARKHMEEEAFETEKRINTLTGILKGIGRIIIWSVFLMIILKRLGIDIGPILAGAGIIGLAVGFGAQELVRDFISGFFMLLENQIRTGDVARINGTSGSVESIELRTTTLRDFEGVVHIFQNGKINSLSNLTKDWSAFAMDIGVAYKENVDEVIEIIKETGGDLKNDTYFGEMMLDSIEVLGLDKFGDSAVSIKARIKTKTNKQWEVGREFNRRLKYAFDKAGIEIPFPHTTIYWGEEISPLKLELQKQAN